MQHTDSTRPTKPTTAFKTPLRTKGRYIVDADGDRVKLASVNWYGASDYMFAPMGLDIRHRDDIAATIRDLGFNSVRFPYSDELVLTNPVVDPAYLVANLDLFDAHPLNSTTSPRALDVYAACITALTSAGLAVIPNNHITTASWCSGTNLCNSSWKNSHLGPLCRIPQTTTSWIANWLTLMTPHATNPLVLGPDLRNEPRGPWGTLTWAAWATAAETAAEALLKLNPHWLIFVEGISSANDCSGAATRPITLSLPHRVVYSAHVYKWSGWGALRPYGTREYADFALDVYRHWGFLLHHDIAPVWVAEFGAPPDGGGDVQVARYWRHLVRVLGVWDVDWGYWALNPWKPARYGGAGTRTYGVLEGDWRGVRWDWRAGGLGTLMGGVGVWGVDAGRVEGGGEGRGGLEEVGDGKGDAEKGGE